MMLCRFTLVALACLIAPTGVSGEEGVRRGNLTLFGAAALEGSYRRAEFAGVEWYEGAIRPDLIKLGLEYDAEGRIGLICAVDLADGAAIDELDVCMRLPAGLLLRIGQFMPPLGLEAEADPVDAKMLEYSFVRAWLKPHGPYDVGAVLSWRIPQASASVALLNGNGRPLGWVDDNRWKDVAARVTWCVDTDVCLGLRGYLGRVGVDGTSYRTVAVQAGWVRGSWQLLSEMQSTLVDGLRRDVGYLQVTRGLPSQLEASLRIQALWARESYSNYGLGLVLGYRPRGAGLAALVGLDRWAVVHRDLQQQASHWRATGEVRVAFGSPRRY